MVLCHCWWVNIRFLFHDSWLASFRCLTMNENSFTTVYELEVSFLYTVTVLAIQKRSFLFWESVSLIVLQSKKKLKQSKHHMCVYSNCIVVVNSNFCLKKYASERAIFRLILMKSLHNIVVHEHFPILECHSYMVCLSPFPREIDLVGVIWQIVNRKRSIESQRSSESCKICRNIGYISVHNSL